MRGRRGDYRRSRIGSTVLRILAEFPAAVACMFQIIFAGGAFGIGIMLAIIGLSLTACYLVIDHLLTIRRQELVPEALQTELIDQFSRGQLAGEAECIRQIATIDTVASTQDYDFADLTIANAATKGIDGAINIRRVSY